MAENFLVTKGKIFSGRTGRIRALILFLVVTPAFLFGLGWWLWQIYWADTLIGYAPPQTAFYLHFSLPQTKDPEKLEQLLRWAAADLSWPEWPAENIRREAAIFAVPRDNNLAWLGVFSFDNKKKMADYLETRQLAHKFLGRQAVAVAADEATLSLLNGGAKNSLAQSLSEKFAGGSAIEIYFNQQFVDGFSFPDWPLSGVYNLLKNDQGEVILSWQARRDGLALAGSRNLNSNKFGQSGVFAASDIFVSLDNLSAWLNNWQSRLLALNADWSQSWQAEKTWADNFYQLNTESRLWQRPGIFLAQRKATTTGRFLTDYDFYLSLSIGSGETAWELSSELAVALKRLWAADFATTQNVYLADGTEIRELAAAPDVWEFSEQDGAKKLSAPDSGVEWWYFWDDKQLVAASRPDWLRTETVFKGNYVNFKTELLPTASFFRYLKIFNLIQLGQKGIWLK